MRVFATIAVILSVHLLVSSSDVIPVPVICPICPVKSCADPDYTIDRCCGDCTNSKCKFHGCVRYGAFEVTWNPSPCIECSCNQGIAECRNITDNCPTRYCEEVGYDRKINPGQCCPECEYGVPSEECRPIPVRVDHVTINMNQQKCTVPVTKYECDKQTVVKNGKKYVCQPYYENNAITITPSQTCRDITQIYVRNVTECRMIPRRFLADYHPRTQPCFP